MVLRSGSFYAADAWNTRAMGRGFPRGRMPIVGGGEATWSRIHADDAALAFVAAAEVPRTGLWHGVDDRPVRMAEFLRAFARRLGARPPHRVPTRFVRLLLGRITVESLLASFPTSNSRFRHDFGWASRFPTYAEGVDVVVVAWRREGFPS